DRQETQPYQKEAQLHRGTGRPRRRAAWSSSSSFEVSRANLRVGQELLPGAAQDDPPGLHHITAIGEPERVVRVLLDKEHRHVLPLIDLANRLEDRFDDERGQPEGGFVE